MTHANASVAEDDYDAAGRLAALRNLKSDCSWIREKSTTCRAPADEVEALLGRARP